MESNKDVNKQAQETKVEDLQVDEAQQDEVKGGSGWDRMKWPPD